MDSDRKLQRIGAVVLIVVIGAATALLLLDGVQLRSTLVVTAYFENIGALREGDDIQVGGKVVGRIDAVQLIRTGSEASERWLDGHSGVAVRLLIQRRHAHKVAMDGEYFVSFRGILGASYLEVGAPRAEGADHQPVTDGAQVRGIDPPILDRVMIRSWKNLTGSRLFLEAVRPEAKRLGAALSALAQTLRDMEPSAGSYSELRVAVADLASEGNALIAELSSSEVDVDRLRDLSSRTRVTLARVDIELGVLKADIDALRDNLHRVGDRLPTDLRDRLRQAADRGAEAVARLRSTAAVARQLASAIERGEGTVGALLNDPEFINEAKKIGKVLKRQPWKLLGGPPDDR